MLNLFSLKEKKEEGAKSGAGNKKKASAAQLRITKVCLCLMSEIKAKVTFLLTGYQ